MAGKELLSPEGRTSFMRLHTPEPNFNKTANIYSVKLMFPKDMDMGWIANPWKELTIAEFGKPDVPGLRPLFSAGNPRDDKGSILDGDWYFNSLPEAKQGMYETYRGMWVMSFNAPEDRPPAVVDESRNAFIDKSLFQSGDYARVAFDLSIYQSKRLNIPNASIHFRAIQKMKDGEHFGGGMSTEKAISMFGDAPSKSDKINSMI